MSCRTPPHTGHGLTGGSPRAGSAREARSVTAGPDRPRRLAGVPQGLEGAEVAQRVHRLPEPAMAIGPQLTIGGQALERRSLERHVVALDPVQHRRLQHEVPAVHPGAVPHGLLLEGPHGGREELPLHLVLVDLQGAEAPERLHGRDRGQLAVRPVEVEQLRDVHVGDAVAVGQHERVVAHVLPHPLDPAAGLRLGAGVDQRHAPRLGGVLVDHHGVVAHVEGHVGHVQEVVGEVLLDDVALVAQADHEVAEAVVAVRLHDVPQDRPLADLHHGLGPGGGLFGQAGAETAGKDDDLHDAPVSRD